MSPRRLALKAEFEAGEAVPSEPRRRSAWLRPGPEEARWKTLDC